MTAAAALATILASIGLYPLFETSAWFGTGFGATLVVGATGLLTRRVRLRASLCLLAGLVALLLYVTVLFEPGRALLGVIPTPSSLAAMGRMLSDGWHDANIYAAPVPVLPAIDFFTGAGIGLVAILVDFLAVRVRHAALAGLPLLATYSVPAAVRQETISGLVFLLGAAGYLTLLVADSRERVSAWGRPVFTRYWTAQDERERPDSAPLSASGRRIGLTAVVIAVMVPLAIPGVDPHGFLGIGGGGGNGKGRSDALTGVNPLNPLVSVRRQLRTENDETIFSYRTSDTSSPDYLRMYALEKFDGDTWTSGVPHDGKTSRISHHLLPIDPNQRALPAHEVTTKIKIDRHIHGLDALPLPYPATKVDIKGNWRADAESQTVYSTNDVADGRTFTVTSLHPDPTYQELESTGPIPMAIAARYLPVPFALMDLRSLAKKVTSDATTPYDKAMKLQQWFTTPGNFTYSLDAPPAPRTEAVHEFLLKSRTGYCEQFASGMALLARLLDIPSRIGMGYTAGTQQSDGSWLVRTRDAHAWPELYFAGVGWLRFEPTPAGGGGQGTAVVPSYATPQLAPGSNPINGQPGAGTPASPGANSDPLALHRRPDLPGDQLGAAGPVTVRPKDRTPIAWLLAALVLFVLLCVPAGLRRISRVHRWSRTTTDAKIAHAAWDELRALAIDHRLPWRPSDSPRATARLIIETLDLAESAAGALSRLARAEERARYAREPGASGTLREDVALARSVFTARTTRRIRWLARVFPPSAILTLRGAGTRVLDGFDWLDVATIRRRRRA
jgi:transglutaminase-like putative cysteine protease